MDKLRRWSILCSCGDELLHATGDLRDRFLALCEAKGHTVEVTECVPV